jgi:molecular chaperone DnaK (HSP70)
MTWALGIDLGTTYSTAAVLASGRLEMIGLGAHSIAIPSAVYQGDDVTVVGEAAVAQGDVRPARLAVEFKRQFGESMPILVGERFITADELQGILGVWVFNRACEREGGTPSEVVFTFPAFWGAFRRDSFLSLTRGVVKDTAPVSVVTEPEAAAAYYASRESVPVGAVVGVYDFGGGTFDASVLRRTEDGFEVLGRPAGDDHLGGIDLDTVLLRHVVQQAGLDEDEIDSADVRRVRQIMTLRHDVTLAKELLSEQPTTDIDVAVNGTVTSIRLSRRELEALAEPIVRRTLDVFEEALAFASVAPNDLHSILLVGGASRMPRVAEAAGERWSIPIALDSHPKFAVSLGAAVWTLARQKNQVVRVSSPPPEPTAPPPAEAAEMAAEPAGPPLEPTRHFWRVGSRSGSRSPPPPSLS